MMAIVDSTDDTTEFLLVQILIVNPLSLSLIVSQQVETCLRFGRPLSQTLS
jgi:hypothetical protein